jgi:hypothetical protein
MDDDDGVLNMLALTQLLMPLRARPYDEEEMEALTDRIVETVKTKPGWRKHIGREFHEEEARDAILQLVRMRNAEVIAENALCN